jgi:hypothetical protein
MKAIVLSCDRYRPLTEHMVLCYDKVWPNHPFRFRIPYQDLCGEDDERRDYVHTPVDFQGTVIGLLADLSDEDWIYWCIDDKYPIHLDVPRIQEVMNWAVATAPGQVSGVMFCRARAAMSGNSLSGERIEAPNGDVYLRRKNYSNIWIPQLLRVKVLRHLFGEFPDVIETAKSMDKLKAAVKLPDDHVLVVSEQNHAEFGESTTRGKITQNCYESMLARGMQPPDSMEVDHNKSIYIGRTKWRQRALIKIRGAMAGSQRSAEKP